MYPGGISMERTLPIDSALLGDVLLRLRRDSPAASLRWTLGGRGAAEVEVGFTTDGPGWTSTARLWNYAGIAMTTATVRLVADAPDEVSLTLEPAPDAAPRPHEEQAAIAELGRAAVDELAEELLWHATRAVSRARGRLTRTRSGSRVRRHPRFIVPSHRRRVPETRTRQDERTLLGPSAALPPGRTARDRARRQLHQQLSEFSAPGAENSTNSCRSSQRQGPKTPPTVVGVLSATGPKVRQLLGAFRPESPISA